MALKRAKLFFLFLLFWPKFVLVVKKWPFDNIIHYNWIIALVNITWMGAKPLGRTDTTTCPNWFISKKLTSARSHSLIKNTIKDISQCACVPAFMFDWTGSRGSGGGGHLGTSTPEDRHWTQRFHVVFCLFVRKRCISGENVWNLTFNWDALNYRIKESFPMVYLGVVHKMLFVQCVDALQ